VVAAYFIKSNSGELAARSGLPILQEEVEYRSFSLYLIEKEQEKSYWKMQQSY
jgi:hypothetical protein